MKSVGIFTLLAAVAATAVKAFPRLHAPRHDAPQVDLGYGVYEGVANATTGLNTWFGIRFAAPPSGSLRWQAPRSPRSNLSSIIQADAFGPICPQGPLSSGAPPGTLPETNAGASEDCLFLNVYSPANATGPLPVLVWIHGGGYGAGNGRRDLSAIINANDNTFIGVSIQYRLAAFGFLSSEEVFNDGVVNAGILDQQFALKWVQKHIHLFGGDASRVTISGESAGAGSVMLQSIAYGGSLGNSLFTNGIAASPYLPKQWGYSDAVPTRFYEAFATAAGCASNYSKHANTFDCLVSKDSATLIQASALISQSGQARTWAFLPVTDGTLIPELPSQALLKKKLNGENLLVGHNADEGSLFVPANITTEAGLVDWLRTTFPLFTDRDIDRLLAVYPSTSAPVDPSDPLFATDGLNSPTAVNQSDLATGQQQRAFNIYAETTLVCPTYWMAQAYSGKGRASYKYQYSVGVATHASDVSAYFGPSEANQGPDFALAFRKIWGNFITTNDPSIPAATANGASSENPSSANPATDWPEYTVDTPLQLNLNQTGGTLITGPAGGVNATYRVDPGLQNDFTLVDAYAWEGGRGHRCDFWRNISAIVPE